MSRVLLLFAVSWSVIPSQAVADDVEAIEGLWKKWKAGDDEAYGKLADLGPECRQLAPRIVDALCDSDEESNWNLDELGLLKEIGADAVPAIVAGFSSLAGEHSRRRLVLELEILGPMARPAGDTLLKIAVEGAGDLRDAAICALSAARLKKDFLIPQLVQRLSQSNLYDNVIGIPAGAPDQVAASAASMLGQCPDERARLPLFKTARTHPKAGVRELALQSLVNSYGPDDLIVTKLIDGLDDNEATGGGFMMSGSVAGSALGWLLRYETLRADAAPRLIARLYRASFEPPGAWPQDLCEVICRCPTTDKRATVLVNQKLRPLLGDDALIIEHHFPGGPELERKRMQVAAASVVFKWDPADRTVADLLARVAGEESHPTFQGPKGTRIPDIRAEATRGLGRAGPAAREWLPLLHRIMQREARSIAPDERPSELAFDAAWAIAQIDPDDEQCMSVLRRVSNEFELRRLTWPRVEAVLGKRAAKLTDVGVVLTTLKSTEQLHYFYRPWDWQKLEPHFGVVAPILFEHLKSNEIAVRRAAVRALSHFKSHVQPVVPKLVEMLRDPRAVIRAAVADALKGFQPLPQEALEALERATRDEFLTVRLSAENALAAQHPILAK